MKQIRYLKNIFNVLVKETLVNDCILILRGVQRHIESDFDGKKFLIQFSIHLFIYIFLI